MAELPRAGVAWDVTGDGRTAVRSSYGMNYDFPSAGTYIAASASPFANRVELSAPFEDPYRNVPGGDTHPLSSTPPIDAQFPHVRCAWRHGSRYQLGARPVMERDNRATTWGVVAGVGQLSRQLCGSPLGTGARNPGNFMGLGPCTIHGQSFPPCTVTGNVDRRRTLYLENPVAGSGCVRRSTG